VDGLSLLLGRDERIVPAGIKDQQRHLWLALAQIQQQLGDAEAFTLELFLPAKAYVRHVAWQQKIQPFNLHAVAGEVDCRRVTRIDLVEELLPLRIEGCATDIFGRDDFEAEWFQRCANGSRIVDRALKLLLWPKIVVLVDANNEGNALLGLRSR
jgi:hypothetical protein